MKDRKEVEPVGRGDVKDLGVLEKANTIIRTSYVGKIDSFLIKENKKKNCGCVTKMKVLYFYVSEVVQKFTSLAMTEFKK